MKAIYEITLSHLNHTAGLASDPTRMTAVSDETAHRHAHRMTNYPAPRSGCDQFLGQIFNLGVKSHDDLCHGLATLLNPLVQQGLDLPKFHWIEP